MSERFYCPDITDDVITLTGSEAHHLIHVMRAKIGETVVLFDGAGSESLCKIEEIGKREATLRVLERREHSRGLPVPLTIASPLPKGDRQRFLIEKLTELGVTTFVPLLTERTVVHPPADVAERLSRIVIEACKQCGRNSLMQITAPQKWRDFLAQIPETAEKWLAHPVRAVPQSPDHPAARPESMPWKSEPASNEAMVAAVGPEGGLTDAEVDAAAEAGFVLVDLGPRILRVETAAITLAVLLGASQQIALHRSTP